MEGRHLVSSNEDPAEANIYADKSALILDWLLHDGGRKEAISLREVAKGTGVSLGLVQRTFASLIQKGFLQTKGVRTAKKFFFKKPELLLAEWLEHYNLVKKCKLRTYRSHFSCNEELFDALRKSKLTHAVALALHSAAQAFGLKNTSLTTLELYVLESSAIENLEKVLQLDPQEKGYEILLIEPYYESLIKRSTATVQDIKICPILLTFLDLYHFPLRGREQAEFLAQKTPELNRIYKDGTPYEP